jgi:hypothetical protein
VRASGRLSALGTQTATLSACRRLALLWCLACVDTRTDVFELFFSPMGTVGCAFLAAGSLLDHLISRVRGPRQEGIALQSVSTRNIPRPKNR